MFFKRHLIGVCAFTGAVVAALEGTELDTGLSLSELSQLSAYWEQARGLYVP